MTQCVALGWLWICLSGNTSVSSKASAPTDGLWHPGQGRVIGLNPKMVGASSNKGRQGSSEVRIDFYLGRQASHLVSSVRTRPPRPLPEGNRFWNRPPRPLPEGDRFPRPKVCHPDQRMLFFFPWCGTHDGRGDSGKSASVSRCLLSRLTPQHHNNLGSPCGLWRQGILAKGKTGSHILTAGFTTRGEEERLAPHLRPYSMSCRMHARSQRKISVRPHMMHCSAFSLCAGMKG